MSLQGRLIKLAYENPELQADLLPLLKKSYLPESGHNVPRDVYMRAGRRWLDALERKGFAGAIRATEIRIDRIKPGSEKAEGIAQYLKGWVKEERPKGAQKTTIQRLIQKAEDKAHQFTARKQD